MKTGGDGVLGPETGTHSQVLEIHLFLCGASTHIPSWTVPKELHRKSPAGQHGSHKSEHQGANM